MTNNPTAIERAEGVAAHTPTPWKIVDDSWKPWEGALSIDGADGNIVAWTPSGGSEAANTAFIVKAVNNHEALVAALKQIAEGSFPGASDLAISSDWQSFANKLQTIARDAFDSVASRDVHAA